MTVVECYGEDEKLLATAMALCSDAEVDEHRARWWASPPRCALVAYADKLGLPKAELTQQHAARGRGAL